MTSSTPTDTNNAAKPIIFLAFANDRGGEIGYLRNLPEEARQVRAILDGAAKSGHCEVVMHQNVTVETLLDVFQDGSYRNRIALFHYGGHAESYELLLETAAGKTAVADAGGLAAFLSSQCGLQLVFLNGCSTQPQVQGLLDAGVAAVIATAQAIDDTVATDFAVRFYKGLAGGAAIATAFHEAEAACRTAHGGQPRGVYVKQVTSSTARRAVADRWPWALTPRPGAELVLQWNLPEAANDPLFGLPALPPGDLPESPFRNILWFRREDAPIFFGRGHDIRQLWECATAAGGAPIVLYYGQSGVGKSSLLAAGLLPRLEQVQTVFYARRDQALGLAGTLGASLSEHAEDAGLLSARWRAIERETGKPLTVLLDQVEEVYTRPNTAMPGEMAGFLDVLDALFSDSAVRPQGRLILSFRKEWVAEIGKLLADHQLPHTKVFLQRLEKRGIVEAVTGPARNKRLQRHFGLMVEPALAGEIADDLLSDPSSAVAPTLQILLSKMWRQAKARDYDSPLFNGALYQELRRQGLLLSDFLDQQLVTLRGAQPAAVDSGLALDLLAFHTTPLGTAEQRTLAELHAAYAHQAMALPDLLAACRDLYLLVDPAENRPDAEQSSRLAHDTLAPLVRQRFDESDAPGQRARRILESRGTNGDDTPQTDPLGEADLAIVDAGQSGMRVWQQAEVTLIELSRAARESRRKRDQLMRSMLVAAMILIGVAAGFAFWQWGAAQVEAENARTAEAAAQAEATRADQNAAEAQVAQANAEAEAKNALAAKASAQVEAENARLAQANAEANARLSKASELVTYVQTELSKNTFDPSLALLLAAAAVNSTWMQDGYVSTNADAALQRAVDDVQGIGWQISLPSYHHSGPVNTVTFSPDGLSILSGSADQSVRVWDTNSGKQLRLLTGHVGPVIAAAFDADQEWLVTGGDDGTVRLWNSREIVPPEILFRSDSWIRSLAIHPTSKLIAAGLDSGKILLIEEFPDSSGSLDSHVVTLTGHMAKVNTVTFSTDGNRLITAGADGIVKLWDVDSRTIVGILPSLGKEVKWAGETPDGNILLVGIDGTIDLWDMELNREIDRWDIEVSNIRGVALSRNGKQLATAHDDGTIHLWNLVNHSETAQMKGHMGPVLGVAINPDGKTLVSGGEDGSIRFWDVARGVELYLLPGHTGEVRSAAFSPDESVVVTAGQDGTVRLWDTSSGDAKRVLARDATLPALVRFVSYSPNGKTVAIANDDGSVQTWNLSNDKLLPCFPASGYAMRSVVYSADGKTLLIAGDDAVIRLLDASDCVVYLEMTGHTGKIRSAQFSSDGNQVVSASEDGTSRVWDIASGTEKIPPLRHPDWVMYATFNPDATRVVTGSRDRVARIWDVATGEIIHELRGHAGFVRIATFSPDGRFIITADEDGTTWIWDAANGLFLRKLMIHEGVVRFAAFSPRGEYVVTVGDDGTARIWEIDPAPTERILLGHTDMVRAAIFSPDGSIIATSSVDGSAVLWDAETGRQVQKLDGEGHTVWSIIFHPNGKLLMGGGDDGIVRVWELTAATPVRRVEASYAAILSLAFSPDGKSFVTAGKDRIARIWDAETYRPIRILDEGAGTIWSAVFSPDGKTLATAGEYGGLSLWDIDSDQGVQVFEDPSAWIWCIAYDASGTKIAVAGKDGHIRILNSTTGILTQEFSGHTGLTSSVAFTQDGKGLVSAGEDKLIRFWNLETGRQFRQLSGHTDTVWSIAFSPDQHKMVSASLDQSARIWNVEINSVLLLAQHLVQRDPPLLTVAEQELYGLDPSPFKQNP